MSLEILSLFKSVKLISLCFSRFPGAVFTVFEGELLEARKSLKVFLLKTRGDRVGSKSPALRNLAILDPVPFFSGPFSFG